MADSISDADLATVRRQSGDSDRDGYELSNPEIEAVYLSTTTGQEDINRTTYYVILQRLGLAANEIANSDPSTGFSISGNQKFEQIERLRVLWAGITGIGSSVSIGRTFTNTYRTDSRQTEEPTYDRATVYPDLDVDI